MWFGVQQDLGKQEVQLDGMWLAATAGQGELKLLARQQIQMVQCCLVGPGLGWGGLKDKWRTEGKGHLCPEKSL